MDEPAVSDETPHVAESWPRRAEPERRQPAPAHPEPEVPADDGAPPGDLASRWQATAAGRTGVGAAGRRGWATRVVAVVLIVAFAFGAVWYYLQNGDHARLLSAQRSAATAARADVLLVSNYSYQTLDQNFAAVQKAATPQFASRFKQSLTGNIQKLLIQYKATSKGAVQAVGVERASGGRAVVLVAFDQTVTNSASPGKPTTEHNRAQVTLTRSGGRWLLSDLQLL